MDTPTRRTVHGSEARKERRNANSPYARSTTPRSSKKDEPQSAIPPASSIRSLFNFVSSPFRSSKPARPPPSPDSDSGSEEGSDEEVDSLMGESPTTAEGDRGMEDDEEDEEKEERKRRMKESTIRMVEAKKSKEPVKELPVSLMAMKSQPPTSSMPRPPLPPPNSSEWKFALPPAPAAGNHLDKSSTHAHAFLQMHPSPAHPPQQHQPRPPKYIPFPSLPPLENRDEGVNGKAGASHEGAGGGAGMGSGLLRAQEIMRRTLEEKLKEGGLTREEMEECQALLKAQSGGRDANGASTTSIFSPPPSRQAAASLFHPGTSAASRIVMPPPTSTASLRQSTTSSLSFLSPSRHSNTNSSIGNNGQSRPTTGTPLHSSARQITTSLPSTASPSFLSSSLSKTAKVSSTITAGSPARRRPIYLGPGVSSPQRRPGSGSTIKAFGSFEAARRADVLEGGGLAPAGVESPGKRRRLEGEGEERIGFTHGGQMGSYASSMLAASGMGGTAPGGDGQERSRKISGGNGKQHVSGGQSTPIKPTAGVNGSGQTSPFTFSVPFQASSSSNQQQSSSASAPLAAPLAFPTTTVSSTAKSPAPPSAPASPAKSSLSLSVSRYARPPSLVAPSPLRHSTSFDSPEAKKNSPKGNGSKEGVVGGVEKKVEKEVKKTKAAQMLMDMIEEEEAAKPKPTPTPVYNPYQSAGLASPSPRRNPRRSAASTARSRANTPVKKSKLAESTNGGQKDKPMTALELIQRDANGGKNSTPSAAKKQKSNGSEESTSPSTTPSRPPHSSSSSNPFATSSSTSTTPSAAPAPTSTSSKPAAPPAWASSQPPTVLFAQDAFPSSSSKKQDQDSDMTGVDASPARTTLDTFKALSSPAFTPSSPSLSNKKTSKAPESLYGSISPSASATKSPEPSSFSFGSTAKKDTIPSIPQSPSSPLPSTGILKSPKTVALETVPHLLPVYTFVFTTGSTPLPTSAAASEALDSAKKASESELPRFDLLSKKSPVPAPASSTGGGGFDWAAAGLTPKPSGGPGGSKKWDCPTCMISNASDVEKCVACEEPNPTAKASSTLTPTSTSTSSSSLAPKPPPSSTSGGFNWAAAGLTPKSSSGGSKWDCPTCMVSNPNDADKCVACEEPNPNAAAAAKSPSSSSSSAAPKPVSSTPSLFSFGSFSPSSGPAAAATPSFPSFSFPSSSTPASASSTPAPAPTSSFGGGGAAFNFAAAGMAAPRPSSGSKWPCPTCMISNGSDAEKCVACEEPNPTTTAPGPSSSSTTTTTTMTSPALPPASTNAAKPSLFSFGTAAPSFPSGGSGSATFGSFGSTRGAGGGGGGFTFGSSLSTVAPKTSSPSLFTFGGAPAPSSSSGSGEKPAAAAAAAAAGGGGAGGGFNWAAAGMKAPGGSGGEGKWTCGTCMVGNVKGCGKCVACEEPEP